MLDLWFDGLTLLTALSLSKDKLTILREAEGSSRFCLMTRRPDGGVCRPVRESSDHPNLGGQDIIPLVTEI